MADKNGEALLGIDLGTTGLKAVIYIDGRAAGGGYCNYKIYTPQTGFAEQKPDDWAKAMSNAVKEALNQSGIKSSEIKAVGFSGQMHGLVMLDENGLPVYNAVIWCDTRTSAQCDNIIKKIGGENFYNITQNNISCGFQACSLLWFKENRSEIYKKIKYIISPKDYLRKLLCGKIGCDITDASATLLYDNIKNKWSDEIISGLGFKREFFPEVYYPSEIAGYINKSGAELTGLNIDTPVVFGGADQPMQAIANGIISSGNMSLVIGTGGQIFYSADLNNKISSRSLNTFYHAVFNKKYFLAATLGAGLSLNWFCEKILKDKNYKKLDKEAAEVPAGSDGIIFLPHLTGERTPYMNPYARGIFWGMSLESDKKYLYRALMEGIAYSLRDALEELKNHVDIPDIIIAAGGAFKSNIWAQICADVLEKELHVTSLEEASAAGAAICAGVGCGIFKNIESGSEIFNRDNFYKIYKADSENKETYKIGFEKYRKIYKNNSVIK